VQEGRVASPKSTFGFFSPSLARQSRRREEEGYGIKNVGMAERPPPSNQATKNSLPRNKKLRTPSLDQRPQPTPFPRQSLAPERGKREGGRTQVNFSRRVLENIFATGTSCFLHHANLPPPPHQSPLTRKEEERERTHVILGSK
jgi:hypothetical protein